MFLKRRRSLRLWIKRKYPLTRARLFKDRKMLPMIIQLQKSTRTNLGPSNFIEFTRKPPKDWIILIFLFPLPSTRMISTFILRTKWQVLILRSFKITSTLWRSL
jgi:hypothetical protein